MSRALGEYHDFKPRRVHKKIMPQRAVSPEGHNFFMLPQGV